MQAAAGGVFERFFDAQAAEKAAEQAGDGGITGAGGAAKMIDHEGGRPEFPPGPVGGVARLGGSHTGEGFLGGGFDIEAAGAGFEGDHFGAEGENLIGKAGIIFRREIIDQFGVVMPGFHFQESVRIQHIVSLFHGRDINIHKGENFGEDFFPGGLAGGGGRVRQGHVAGGGGAGLPGDLEDTLQFAAFVLEHAFHQRRIAEMEMTALPDEAGVEVFSGKDIVGAGIVQEDAVDTGRGYNDGIGTSLIFEDVDPVGIAAAPEDVDDEAPELIVPHASAKADLAAEGFHVDPGIGDRAAGTDFGLFDVDQFAGAHDVPDGFGAGVEKEGDNIQAQVAGDHDIIVS
ncbi:MAG: hypothetical protein BWY71_01646 [Planctomycetes bacterium ADurb.Bin412]|nr:MAG: hypothetical protein BWY71_01646 [Planctomycetes bacterium ADurb.Bin412]